MEANTFYDSQFDYGYVMLINKGTHIEALSDKEINIGDNVQCGYFGYKPVLKHVVDVLESRTQAGVFKDESKRRTWYKLKI